VFYDINRAEPSYFDLFTADIVDGRNNVLHRRLFAVETTSDGTILVRQPTLFLDLVPAPPDTSVPSVSERGGNGSHQQLEQALIEQELNNLKDTVAAERAKEIETVSHYMEISLGTLIERYNLRLNEYINRQLAGDTDPLLSANMQQAENRLDELEARRTRRREELRQERNCTIANIRKWGSAWVLPHPDRSSPRLAPMVRDTEIERIAVQAVRAYEEAPGWQVESVEDQNKGFDLISRRFADGDQEFVVEMRFIEVKGRARTGIVALTSNEYHTAYRLKEDYWLYVVFNCAHNVPDGPDVYPIQDPARLRWEPMREVIQYRVDPQTIIDEAGRQPTQLSQVQQAFREAWDSRIADYGPYNILVEG
ncbi:MAG: DUF3883 domain-containing protein, partial [Caldilineaceae bacterium]|nr:DUF3883 domain-containing protein [Caldilineaceae bacterium]